MSSLRLRSIAPLLLLLACPLAAQDGSRTYNNRYQIRYLTVHAAQTVAWEQCPKKDACEIKGVTEGRGAILDVNADSATHAALARAFAERDVPRTQSFHLVVLAAGNKPNGPPPTLSKGAQKALDDIQGFLPFKNYRLLDTVFVRVNQEDVAHAQVAGFSGSTYGLILRFRAGGADGKKLFIDGFHLEDAKDNNLIQTTFAMDVGETVVVGTSSTPLSQEALVAILTAVP
ncbi:MAG TPA: hypothetical protein VN493_22420 [Thermoanaerobaculia bacterium]|nr:hypothetical protein [Thermoanaerobaculia bacterium]